MWTLKRPCGFKSRPRHFTNRSSEQPVMRILLDVMGGDLPPQELVRGGIAAAQRHDIDLVFAGDPSVIEPVISKEGKRGFEILPSRSVIRMDDPPVKSVRDKPDSSLVLGLRELKAGEVDAFVSPGTRGRSSSLPSSSSAGSLGSPGPGSSPSFRPSPGRRSSSSTSGRTATAPQSTSSTSP